jgi:hypothetical protein
VIFRTRQQGNVAGGQCTCDGGHRLYKAVSTDVLELFFLQRYRAADAAEMAHFFDVLENGETVLTSINDWSESSRAR